VKVADLMTRDVRSCRIHDSLNAAARIMWDHDCGCAPVVRCARQAHRNNHRPRHQHGRIHPGHAARSDPHRARDVAKVISCTRTDDLDTAHRLMRTHEIHRIPIVDSAANRSESCRERRHKSLAWRSRSPSRQSRSRRRSPRFAADASTRRPSPLHRTETACRLTTQPSRRKRNALVRRNRSPIFARRSSLQSAQISATLRIKLVVW